MRHYEVFTGRVGVIGDIKELSNGNCVVNFSVAETPRIKQGDSWVDGTTIWTNVAIFGDEARNLHRSVKPGTFVTVWGTRQAREYTTKDTQEKRVVQSVVAEQVAISVTKFNFIEGVGNVNYAKEGTSAPVSQAQTQPAPASVAAPATENADPFASVDLGDSDPFGDDDDPFGLNS